MTPLDLILSKLPQAKRTGSKRTTRCPAHDDQRASLSIGVGDDGRVLIHCHAGCTPEAVVAALGLRMADLMPMDKKRTGTSTKARPTSRARTGKSEKKGQEVYATAQDAVAELEHRHGPCSATWTYHDVSGETVGVVVRWDKPGGKDIRPASKTTNGWVIGGMPLPRPLYRLPDLLARPSEQVYVCEGEKAADAAASIDLLATCSAHGAESATKSDWQPLAGRDVVILPDNDPAGEKYASEVRRILLHFDPPAKVRIVRLPGLAEHGDIADFADSRDAAEPEALKAQVLGLAEKVELETEHGTGGAAPQLDIVTMSDVRSEPVRWLWRERFPYGMLSLLVGIEGSGKTFLGLDMAARISTGNLWPDARGAEDAPVPGNVILMSSEDALAHTIRPRLDAMGADTGRIQAVRGIKYPKGRQFFNVLEHLPLLEKVIEQHGDVRLVLIDPLTAFLGKTDQNANAEVRDALVRLSDLAERYGCAIIGISHFAKDTNRAAIHRTIGSVAFSATARAIWLVNADEEDPERRLVIPVKMNVARPAKAMAFRIEDNAVVWEPGQFDYNADAILGTARRNPALTRAKHWLQGLLAQGPVPQTKVQELAARVEPTIAERTLDRAKGALHVESKHEGFGDEGRWIWRLPDAPVASATDDGDEQ